MQDIWVLSELQGALVEVFLSGFVLFAPFAQLQQQVVFDVLKLNGRYPAFDDPSPEGVDVHLQQRDRSDQQVIASANQVHVQQQVVTHQTEHSLVVGNCIARSELNDDFFVRIARKGTPGVIEPKNVAAICKKLEICVELAVIMDGQHLGTGVF